jgi:hypothetical protein
MQSRFQRSADRGARNDAALEEVRRLFERYRAHARAAVKRPGPRKTTQESQRDAELRANVAP